MGVRGGMRAEALGLLTRKAEGGYWQPLLPQLREVPLPWHCSLPGQVAKVRERSAPLL